MEKWEIIMDEADKYYKISAKGINEKKKFTNDFYHNTMMMAIERYFVALLEKNKILPRGHDIETLYEDAKNILDKQNDLTKDIEYLNSINNLCALEVCPTIIPHQEEIKKLFMICNEVRLQVFDALSLASIK